METNIDISIYDKAISQLENLQRQLTNGLIIPREYEQQRLCVLVDLVIDGINKFGKGE